MCEKLSGDTGVLAKIFGQRLAKVILEVTNFEAASAAF